MNKARFGRSKSTNFFQLVPKSKSAYSIPLKIPYRRVSKKQDVYQHIKNPQFRPKSNKIVPTFNPDGKYFTPSFINPYCLVNRFHWEEELYQHHLDKLKQSLEEIPCQQLLMPKPRKGASLYCSVCRSSYQDYRDHILSKQHKQKCRQHPFTQSIQELCKNVNQSSKNACNKNSQRIKMKRCYQQVWDKEEEEKVQKKTLNSSEQGSSTMLFKSNSKQSTGQEPPKRKIQGPMIMGID